MRGESFVLPIQYFSHKLFRYGLVCMTRARGYVVMLTSIDPSQEIVAKNKLTALKSSLNNRCKHVLPLLRQNGYQPLIRYEQVCSAM